MPCRPPCEQPFQIESVGRAPVERVDDRLRFHGHLVHRRDTRNRSPSPDGRARRRRCCRRDRCRCWPWRSPRQPRPPSPCRRWCRPIRRCRPPGTFRSISPTGSQTSILMSESLDGVSVAATRQNAGSVANARLCGGTALTCRTRGRRTAGRDFLRDGDLRVVERQARERITRRSVRRDGTDRLTDRTPGGHRTR